MKIQTKTFSQDLQDRHLIYQCTDNSFFSRLEEQPVTVYCGFDPTADSFHLGSLLPLIMLKRFQLAGHRPVVLMGGATGMIGDPSGKSQERTLLSRDVIENNILSLKKTIEKFLDFSGSCSAKIVNNKDWFQSISWIKFLRDIGKYFSMNYMMAKDSVRTRFQNKEQGISYTEFSYMLMQAYDFLHLYIEEGCQLQIGGSDQWGNLTAGCELIKRKGVLKEDSFASGLTFPLLLKADGSKFGKSEEGNIWLDPEKTSPYKFYQFLRQTPDEEVIMLLKRLTFLSLEDINELQSSMQINPEERIAQEMLATTLTKLIHGEEESQRVSYASKVFFTREIKQLDEKMLLDICRDVPSATLDLQMICDGGALPDLLTKIGMYSSKSAVKRDVKNGGLYLNNNKLNNPHKRLSHEDFISGSYLLFRKGKKHYFLLRGVSS